MNFDKPETCDYADIHHANCERLLGHAGPHKYTKQAERTLGERLALEAWDHQILNTEDQEHADEYWLAYGFFRGRGFDRKAADRLAQEAM